jgi:hypothetical protein
MILKDLLIDCREATLSLPCGIVPECPFANGLRQDAVTSRRRSRCPKSIPPGPFLRRPRLDTNAACLDA